jgi:hypothetical protein
MGQSNSKSVARRLSRENRPAGRPDREDMFNAKSQRCRGAREYRVKRGGIRGLPGGHSGLHLARHVFLCVLAPLR